LSAENIFRENGRMRLLNIIAIALASDALAVAIASGVRLKRVSLPVLAPGRAFWSHPGHDARDRLGRRFNGAPKYRALGSRECFHSALLCGRQSDSGSIE
jgi:hypothetical protein